jgi:hypothetical protein
MWHRAVWYSYTKTLHFIKKPQLNIQKLNLNIQELSIQSIVILRRKRNSKYIIIIIIINVIFQSLELRIRVTFHIYQPTSQFGFYKPAVRHNSLLTFDLEFCCS